MVYTSRFSYYCGKQYPVSRNLNPITAEGIRPILSALECNNTLQRLQLPDYPDDVKRDIKLVEEDSNKKRANHGSRVKLLIDFEPQIEHLC